MPPKTSPKITAHFETDNEGNPRFLERGGQKHYKLVFEVENAPSDVYAGTFELDPTYYDPVRTVRPEGDGRLRLKTTSYGDYDLKVRLRTAEGSDILIVDSVVDALQRARNSMPSNHAVDKAIEYLAAH